MTWIQTYTGKKFDAFAPTPEMIDIKDIAHAMSHICRFNGHTMKFYSVAQHSVLVAQKLDESGRLPRSEAYRRNALRVALLHDAAEIYISDIPRPVKQMLGVDIKKLEHSILRVIFETFNVVPSYPTWGLVHEFDNKILMTEARDLLRGNLIKGWGEGLPEPFDDVIHAWPSENAKLTWLGAWNETIPPEECDERFQGQWKQDELSDRCEAGSPGGEGAV